MTNQKIPYLSFVATSRNDDHGGGMLRRMRIFLRGLDQQAKRHGMNAELVLVEWNPPADRPPLHQVLPSPCADSPLVIRYITVANEIHRRWRHWETIPLFQMIAKNAGIRRARGEFVLSTNVDLLFSDNLCAFLARQVLDPGKMYRANRCDVPQDIGEDLAIADQLVFCEQNIIRRCGHEHGKHSPDWQKRIKKGLKRVLGRPLSQPAQVDTDACGDFTLLSKKAWAEIRGYPEMGLFSIYVDGLGVHAAASMGYEAVNLPPDHCTFHAEHHTGWTTVSILEKIKLMQERPFLDYATYGEAVRWMWEHHRPLPVNDENWGCRQDHLPEIRVSGQGMIRGEADA